MPHSIKKGAIFIADAHESEKRKYFWQFLQLLKTKQIPLPEQIFLLGDMFDLLVGGIKHTEERAKAYIDELESLANICEIYYFEGNHDFNLKKIFKNVKVIPYNSQPMEFNTDFGKVLILHGDKFISFSYFIYTFLLRTKFIIFLLNLINNLTNYKISANLYKNLEQKNICTSIKNYKQIIKKRLSKFATKSHIMVAEGHFHQDKEFEFGNVKYINFGSFACNQSYYIVEFDQSIKFTSKSIRGHNV